MAQSDMKTISELTDFPDLLADDSVFPVVANLGEHLATRKIAYLQLKKMILGYDLTGVLTAGSTSLTITSVPVNAYNSSDAYTAGALVTYTDADENVRNYICVNSCSAGTWETNCVNFAEIDTIDSSSNLQIFTNPAVNYESISVASGAVTLTFTAQSSDVAVKVRVS